MLGVLLLLVALLLCVFFFTETIGAGRFPEPWRKVMFIVSLLFVLWWMIERGMLQAQAAL